MFKTSTNPLIPFNNLEITLTSAITADNREEAIIELLCITEENGVDFDEALLSSLLDHIVMLGGTINLAI